MTFKLCPTKTPADVYCSFQGADQTVFFLSIGKNYEPIGFVKVPSEVTHLEWSPAHFVSIPAPSFLSSGYYSDGFNFTHLGEEHSSGVL